MKVQFVTNVGTRDAKAHGLDYSVCLAGSVHDFPGDKARQLIEAKLAREPVEPETPAPVRATRVVTETK